MKTTLNDMCTVALSEAGAAHLNDINRNCNDMFYSKSLIAYRAKTDYVKGDMYRAQLWSIMEIFGPTLGLGSDAPFVNCEMNIKVTNEFSN